MARTLAERIESNNEFYNKFGDNLYNNLRVAIPGIIQSFDSITQTVTVQPAIKENIRNNDLTVSNVNLPLLLDVPIVIPRVGGFALTMPIQQGDECLVIFADMCIDSWWNSGGIQSQLEKRRHDLSDAFAILGTWSQPNKIVNYNNTATELINLNTGTGLIIDDEFVDIHATSVKFNGSKVSIGQPGPVGPTGETGPKGDTGPQGIQGVKGDTGSQGPIGLTGLQGAKGDTGIQGAQGLKGDTGATGAIGPQGPKGDTGATGAQGIQGEQGVTGTTGLQGPPTYTWIKYATDASGTGISDAPSNMTYIGIADNKSTATPSVTPSDYTWALFQGPQGPAGPGSGDMLKSVYDTDGNGIVNNSEALNGKISGNASGNIPISNGIINTNLIADMVDNLHLWKGTQAAFNAITVKDESTIYFVTLSDANKSCLIYAGTYRAGGYF